MAYSENKQTTVRENNRYFEIEQSYKTGAFTSSHCFLQSRFVFNKWSNIEESQIELVVSKSTEKRTFKNYFSISLTKEEAEKLALNIAPWLKK